MGKKVTPCLVPGVFCRSARPADWQSATESRHGATKVTAVVQTHDGYLWVGTYSGLARFDGVRL